jgi:site-specific DNA-methyltransferase (adenine-specific)
MAENILYYGDNLEILRRYIEDESVDLVYLDPPFKSDQDYNILFAERNGAISSFNLHSEIRNLKCSPACGGKERRYEILSGKPKINKPLLSLWHLGLGDFAG